MDFKPTVKEGGPGDTEDRHIRNGIMKPVSPSLPGASTFKDEGGVLISDQIFMN